MNEYEQQKRDSDDQQQAEEERKEKLICVLCNNPITDDIYGHNPQPLSDGVCCTKCNKEKVIPERFKRIRQAMK